MLFNKFFKPSLLIEPKALSFILGDFSLVEDNIKFPFLPSNPFFAQGWNY